MPKKTARHPYEIVVCPYTRTRLLVKESQLPSGGWGWLFRGQFYDSIDDIIEARAKKFSAKEVDFGQ